jgi:hypothetical protein
MISPNSNKNYIHLIKIFLTFTFVLIGQSAVAVGPYGYSADGSEVTDQATGLVWRRCSEGQTWSGTACTGTALILTHQAALERAATQSGWRLPNIKELSSLSNKANTNPAIDVAAFPGTVSSYYWSSSPYAIATYFAWFVNFSNSAVIVSNRSTLSYLRLVR